MSNFDAMSLLHEILIYFIPFLFALTFHEFAHGLVAQWLGDNTAKMMGRLTMNPAAHADPVGTFVLPVMAIAFNSPFFFGWAKPVPVNERNLKRPRQDMFWIAIAGPMSNVFLAVVGTVLMAIAFRVGAGDSYYQLLDAFLMVNLFLAFFNLIPIHPLDGGKVVAPFLPASWNIWLENNQGTLNMFLLIFILLAGRIFALPINALVTWLRGVAYHLATMMM